MSKFGQIADIILEMLHNREKIDIDEIEVGIPFLNAAIIDFLDEFGLIELDNGIITITNSGLELLA